MLPDKYERENSSKNMLIVDVESLSRFLAGLNSNYYQIVINVDK